MHEGGGAGGIVPTEAAVLARKVWFHKDDYQQVEFLPSTCRDFCLYHLEKIRIHGEEHRAPDGTGWTSRYTIPRPPASVEDLGIRRGDLTAAMPWTMRRANKVLSGGWNGDVSELPRTAAYTRGDCAIILGWDENRIIDRLWFKDADKSWWVRESLFEALFRVGILAPLILVDWRGTLIDLRDRRAIRNYLRSPIPPASKAPKEGGSPESGNRAPMLVDPASHLPPYTAFEFDCEVHVALRGRKAVDGPVRIVLKGPGDRQWLFELGDDALENDGLEFDRFEFDPLEDDSHEYEMEPSPVPFEVEGDAMDADWEDATSDRILMRRGYDGPLMHEVYDRTTGSILLSVPEAACATFTPDGSHLLLVNDDGIAIADLDRPGSPVRDTGLFSEQAGSEDGAADAIFLDNPFSAMAVAASDPSHFTLAIGDYGFVAVAEVRLDPSRDRPLIAIAPPRMLPEGLVYDPVDVVDAWPGEALLLWHGGGSALSLLNLREGSLTDCPLPPGNQERRYGCFKKAVASQEPRVFWVKTDSGPYLWDGGVDLRPLADDADDILATDGTRYIGISKDRRRLIRGRY